MSKVFDIKHFPMDIGRIICSVLVPVFRVKRLTPSGEKYKGRLRGGAVIAANHRSFADPFILGVTFWYRRVYMLIAEVVMGGRLRSALLRGMGGIKVDRNIADIEAIKKSVKVLKDGHPLTLFPEGGIQGDSDTVRLKSGAALIALSARVPIIPVYIAPKKGFFSRRVVVIGEPIDVFAMCSKKMPSTADIEKITDTLAQRMKECVI